jgi:hypothetical protein
MNTVEKNKLIAEFMGMVYDNHGQPNKYWELTDEQNFVSQKPYPQNKDLKFHSDWNWLMEVVEKIETLPDEKFQIEINGKWCNFFDMKTLNSVEFEKADNESKIQNCFEAVVMFIRWYNNKTIEFWEQDFEYLNS